MPHGRQPALSHQLSIGLTNSRYREEGAKRPAALLLGERLPPLKTIWGISGSHVIMAGLMSAGQFAVGGILALLVLGPVFGFTDKAAALIEMSFAGGHGTLAGM